MTRALRLFQFDQSLLQRRAGGFAPELQLRRLAADIALSLAFHLPGDH